MINPGDIKVGGTYKLDGGKEVTVTGIKPHAPAFTVAQPAGGRVCLKDVIHYRGVTKQIHGAVSRQVFSEMANDVVAAQ